MEIIIVMSWNIWTVRNGLIFRGEEATVQKCKAVFKKVFGLIVLRVKKRYIPLINLWLDLVV